MFSPQHIEALEKRTSGFDFLIGEWSVANRRLRRPLSGGGDWYETPATARSTTLHNGAISIDEMWYPELGFAGTSIRVHDRVADDWTIYWVNSQTGHLQAPVRGGWDSDGMFTAVGPDTFEDKRILARYTWHSISSQAATWEQAFSVDDGLTWETNWVMTWTRTS
ncbi:MULTISPECIES: hypothetical protein [Microbacterium]|uniref:DUF1579 domain-containing protein n=1 Tax=Microbacterium wangchenii TaxID=2541726 RepID=A0ABX5SZZ6_9MICO|nr:MULTISPECIES: hypothetical protein [Microbacterium]MCK6066129.1 hypothetical protein [Microbacterium sp. EYE_512]QBR90409.1 hypothetical protein E4K62_18010 [Microbacterium wangchenii]TFV84784.1 hypothetical protein E4V99_07000 [Microbacterium sp. dk485]TXK11575.1 hypothetical protein FVP99_14215 [Microbacterium wangchenii]